MAVLARVALIALKHGVDSPVELVEKTIPLMNNRRARFVVIVHHEALVVDDPKPAAEWPNAAAVVFPHECSNSVYNAVAADLGRCKREAPRPVEVVYVSLVGRHPLLVALGSADLQQNYMSYSHIQKHIQRLPQNKSRRLSAPH